jgi:hypothetical protein
LKANNLRPENAGKIVQIWHQTGGPIFLINPSYLRDANGHPYRWTSFFPDPTKAVGDAFLEFIHDMDEQIEETYNSMNRAVRMAIDKPSVSTDSSGIKPKDMQDQLFRQGGHLSIPGGVNVDQVIKFLDINPMVNEGMAIMGLSRGFIQEIGVADALSGQANADTATLANQQQIRASQKVMSPFRHWVMTVLQPTMELLRDSIFDWWPPGRWVKVVGEDGYELANQTLYLTPDMLSDRLEVDMVASYDFATREARAQRSLAYANIMAKANPELVAPLLEIAMRDDGYRSDDLAKIYGSLGAGTSVQQEMEILGESPEQYVKVRLEDDHITALAMVDALIAEDPARDTWPNIQKYAQEHMLFLNIQAMQAEMAAQMGAGGPGAQGGAGGQTPGRLAADSNQPGNPAADSTRSGAQRISPADRGPQTNAGITGAAA